MRWMHPHRNPHRSAHSEALFRLLAILISVCVYITSITSASFVSVVQYVSPVGFVPSKSIDPPRTMLGKLVLAESTLICR